MSLRYAAGRLGLALPVALLVVSVIFFLIRILPGDPAQAALGENASRAAVDALRLKLGLDAPLGVQYLRFLGDLAHGNLGISMINGASVRDQIAYNLPYTLELTLAALVIGLLAGGPLGLIAAVNRNGLIDIVSRSVSVVGLSAPAFLVGVMLMLVVGVDLGWLPTVGGGTGNSVADMLVHLVLPALALGAIMTGSITRLTRSAVAAVISQDYLRTARAKGLDERMVVLVHALRPSLLPILSLTGVWSVALIGDSVTTEVVFARPGLGKMIVNAVLQRDYTSLQSIMVIYTLLVVGLNLVTDLAYGVADPRTRI